MDRKDIVSFNYEELLQEIESLGEKPYRAKQIYAWLHEKGACSFEEMTNLPGTLRKTLDNKYEIAGMEVAARQISKKILRRSSCSSFLTGTG